jgi:hypothetical protein
MLLSHLPPLISPDQNLPVPAAWANGIPQRKHIAQSDNFSLVPVKDEVEL